jgi:hypothetical protein
MLIKAEAVYKNQGKGDPKFDHFKLTIGDVVFEDLPIRFLRISELPTLEKLLGLAVQEALAEVAEERRKAEQQAGVARYNWAIAGLLEKEKSEKRW